MRAVLFASATDTTRAGLRSSNLVAQSLLDVSLRATRMPGLVAPRKGRLGLVDYEKVFCAGGRDGDIFDARGIDRAQGCVVVVRPDQYVANIVPLEASGKLARFFDCFMACPRQGTVEDAHG